MIDIYKVGKTKLKLNYLLNKPKQNIDIFLCIPENHLSVNKGKVDDSSWLSRGLITKRRYFSHDLSLEAFQNLLSEFIESENEHDASYINRSLNNLWHQYKLALSKDIRQIKTDVDIDCIDSFCQGVMDIQKCFESQETEHRSQFNDLEDLMNWYCYQSVQRFIVFCSASNESRLNTFEPFLKKLVRQLHNRRKIMAYETPETSHQLSHFFESNSRKKRDLRFTVIMTEKMVSISHRYQISILAISAAAAMLGLYSLLVYVGGSNRQITLPILATIAIGYGVREVFKEGIKNHLGKFFKTHFFSWKRIIKDGRSNRTIAKQLFSIRWLTRKEQRKIEDISNRLSLTHYQVLHYKSQCKLRPDKIPKGYEGLEESLILDLDPFSSQLLPEKDPILLLNPDASDSRKIQALFKCYLIIVFDNSRYEQNLVEFHINKDRIINLRVRENISKQNVDLQKAS